MIIEAAPKPSVTTQAPKTESCTVDPNNADQMPEFPPFMTDTSKNLVIANGTDDEREFSVTKGESVYLSCPDEQFLNYPSDTKIEIRLKEKFISARKVCLKI